MYRNAIMAHHFLGPQVNPDEPIETAEAFASPTGGMPGFAIYPGRWPIGIGAQITIDQSTQYPITQLNSSELTSFSTEIVRNFSEFKEEFKVLCERHCGVVQTKIYDLQSDEFQLITPIDAILKIYTDEVIALIPDLELYSDGTNEIESLNALKLELIDLIEDLESMADEELGDKPKAWKRTLKMLVRKCQ